MVAEQIFTMQLLTNLLMLRGSARISGVHASFWRAVGAAVLGAVYAVAQPQLSLLRQPGVLVVILTMMLWLAFGSCRSALRQVLWYFVISLAICGAVVGISRLFGRETVIARGVFLYPKNFRAMVLMAGLAYLVYYLAGGRPQRIICPVTFQLGERRVTLQALQDSGNLLQDPMTGRQVIVADWRIAQRILPERVQSLLSQAAFSTPAQLLQELRERVPKLPVFLIPYHAVGVQSGMLLAVRCDAVIVDGYPQGERLVAFSPTSLDESGAYCALTGGNVT